MAEVRVAALSRAVDAGLSGLLLAGVDLADWQAQGEVQRAAPPALTIGTSFGIHPQIVEALNDAELDDQLAHLARALAGEEPIGAAAGDWRAGIDALTPARRQALPRQERVFGLSSRWLARSSAPGPAHPAHPRRGPSILGATACRALWWRRAQLQRLGRAGARLSGSGPAPVVFGGGDVARRGGCRRRRGSCPASGCSSRPMPRTRRQKAIAQAKQSRPPYRPSALIWPRAARQDAATLSRITAENAYRLFQLPVPRPDARR